MNNYSVILSRRSRVAAGGAAQDGRRTPSLITRKGGGCRLIRRPALVSAGGPSTVLRRAALSRDAAPAAQDDSRGHDA